jgi:CheY-like chemotaxis protein
LSEDGPPPLALVSDVSMAGMDGLELVRRARQRYPLLPVVLVSGYAGPALGQGPAAAAEVHFLAKPYGPRALVEAAGTALAAAR